LEGAGHVHEVDETEQAAEEQDEAGRGDAL